MAIQFSAAPVFSEAGGMAKVTIFRDEVIYMGAIEMDREEAIEFTECLRLGSGLARIFEGMNL